MIEIETWEGEGGATVPLPRVAARPGMPWIADRTPDGSIRMEEMPPVPGSILLRLKPYLSGWSSIANERAAWGKEAEKAGWSFAFMAGEIKITVFDFDRLKSMRGGPHGTKHNPRQEGFQDGA